MNQQTISDIIQELATRNGGHITPAEIVEHARNPDSLLHDQFDWDDPSAAHKNRLDVARGLIRSCKIEFRDSTTTVRTCAAFVRDPELDHKQQGYISTRKLKDNEDLAREALVAKFTQIATELRNARDLSIALGIGSEIEELERKIVGITDIIGDATNA